MTSDVPGIADAVLFEGFSLYPYRLSALKNQYRYPFGTLYPPTFASRYADPSNLELQCLLLGNASTEIEVRLRFLQLERDPAVPPIVRDVVAKDDTTFTFGPVQGALSIIRTALSQALQKLTIRVCNKSDVPDKGVPTRDDALAYALASPHLLLTTEAGNFVSLIDPPSELREHARSCRSQHTWPVLLGTRGSNLAPRLLSAPIILYDHPEVAAESPGDFFDGTEIDELLTLRMLTLTDVEKDEIRNTGGPAGELLERTERLGIGATVRLHPACRADMLDLALEGKEATVRAVERDYEGRTYIAVSVNDDPGQDLGPYGHRFFMRPDEIEPL